MRRIGRTRLRCSSLACRGVDGIGGVPKAQSLRRQDCRGWARIALARQNVENDVGRMDALGQRKLAGSDDGDRQMVKILAAVFTDGLPAVEAACLQAPSSTTISWLQ